LPKEWQQLLQDSGISKSDQEKNPQAVMEIVKFYQEGGGDWEKIGFGNGPNLTLPAVGDDGFIQVGCRPSKSQSIFLNQYYLTIATAAASSQEAFATVAGTCDIAPFVQLPARAWPSRIDDLSRSLNIPASPAEQVQVIRSRAVEDDEGPALECHTAIGLAAASDR
jgi:hypothetical protein